MPTRKQKPTSPGRRFGTWLDRADVTRSRPEKSLVKGKPGTGGRNANGRVTSRHRGGGEKRYILAPQRLAVGASVTSGEQAEIAVGNSLPLSRVPMGTVVHNVELTPGRGGQLGRSAGAAVQLVAKEGKHATLRLPSGEMRMVPLECRATIGTIGNVEHENVSIGKAGRN